MNRRYTSQSGRMRKTVVCLLCRLPVLLLILTGAATPAPAHPLGNFSVNRYSRLELNPETIRIHYVVDMAEIPAFQEIGRMDADGNNAISAAERSGYLDAAAGLLRGGLDLAVGGADLEPALIERRLSMPPGQAGLQTLRMHLVLEAPLPAPEGGRAWEVRYRDDNYKERPGWKEIVVRPMTGVTLLRTDVSQADRSAALRRYPRDRLTDPLDVRRASVAFAAAGTAAAAPAGTSRRIDAPAPRPDRLAALLTPDRLTPSLMLLSLLTAAGLGALHALSPGHGKAIVGAFLVGSRGTVRHALILGLTVTATHTAGVFALGLITLWASQYLLPEKVFPWLGIASGIIVAAMGVTMLRRRLLGKAHHHHHSHSGHEHDHGQLPHHHPHGADHGHVPDGQGPSWRSLLALGVSGGLLPCPSALVVLLGAIALGRIGFGLLLIVAFSLGLAGVLTIVGLLFVSARDLFGRFPRRHAVLTFLPVCSAAVITVAGVGVMVQSAWELF